MTEKRASLRDHLRRLLILANLPRAVGLFLSLVRDPRVPAGLKGLAAAALAYFFLPVDLLPDLFPVTGYLDDLLIGFFVVERFAALCPREVYADYAERFRWHPITFGTLGRYVRMGTKGLEEAQGELHKRIEAIQATRKRPRRPRQTSR